MITQQLLVSLIIITGILMGIVAVLFVYLVLKRKSQQKIADLVDTYIQKYEKTWFDYLICGEPVNISDISSDLKRIEMLAIDRIFFKYSTVLKNEQVKQHISTYANAHMTDYYSSRFSSSNWATRINVLKKITMFDLDFLLPTIEKKLINQQFKSRDEIVLGLNAIAAKDLAKFNEIVQGATVQLNEFEYKVLLSNLNFDKFNEIMSFFNEIPLSFQLAYLDTLSGNSSLLEETILFLESQLQSQEDEIRIRSLKAIRGFGTITSLEPYLHFINSSIWEERLMIAAILKFSDEEKSYYMLRELMKDSHWKVRKEAAIVLKQKKLGTNVLQDMSHQTEDKYAAEISKEVLALG